jgi:hypothetical protein
MGNLRTRVELLGLSAGVACVLSLAAGAAAAEATTYHGCVNKKSGVLRVGKKCKKGEKKISFNNQGVPGASGKNGTNGTNGKNGTNGTNGTNGANLLSNTPLASGQSESGWFSLGAGEQVTNGEIGEGISFAQPLASGIPEGNVVVNPPGTESSAHCPGLGRAERGFLCFYTAENHNMEFVHALNFNFTEFATGLYGFALYFDVLGANSFVDGSWTVTAP